MRYLVDGMNVIGTRPDGWWKDRDAAMLRLVDRLERWSARTGADAELFEGLDALAESVDKALDSQLFHVALETVFHSVRAANGYITQQQPWALKKTDPGRMEAVLRHLHTALRTYATVLQPFMPGTMARMLDQLGVPSEGRGLAALAVPLPGGTALPPPEPLPVFPAPERDAPPPPVRSALGVGEQPRRTPGDEEFSGLRPYLPGDSPRQVSWRHAARTGALLTRETDAPAGAAALALN